MIYNSFDKSVIPQKIELMFNIYLMRFVSMASTCMYVYDYNVNIFLGSRTYFKALTLRQFYTLIGVFDLL